MTSLNNVDKRFDEKFGIVLIDGHDFTTVTAMDIPQIKSFIHQELKNQAIEIFQDFSQLQWEHLDVTIPKKYADKLKTKYL